jgi:hypothetical protein
MTANPALSVRHLKVHSDAAPSQCPYCDQPIPVDQADQVRRRIKARERDRADELAASIRVEVAREWAEGDAAVRQKIAALRAVNAGLQEAMTKQVAAAEQQNRAALRDYDAIVKDSKES